MATPGAASLNSDGPFNIDDGLMKNFRITERIGFQFHWETFNLINTPRSAIPIPPSAIPDFGTSRASSSTPRQMQFALRLSF